MTDGQTDIHTDGQTQIDGRRDMQTYKKTGTTGRIERLT